MKEECKMCSVNGWGGAPTTDFSISSLMRPVHEQAHTSHMEQRHDAVLLSAYLFKLGYYQPAGPLIKETVPEAERALARYHPPPHYHAPHPPVLQQYGPPYYPADLCYGRYYRPQGPYHMPPQPDSQMVGVGSEPYPPPQYYGAPPCYQHSPQRIPYVEYRGCPCPLNACPKNVLIGPATGKAPTGAGPDVHPPGGCRVARRVLDAGVATDTYGSGKDPPLEPEPPARADGPHPCPVPAIGGSSPKREVTYAYDVRDNMRLAGDIPGPEALGPPSPARGSAGACAPQPPPIAPRRARLGKAMARRSLAGDDTSLLISTPQPLQAHSDADDDVLAISPPICAPIDLSSSDERSTPLVDVKKENEGPTCAASRKTDAQALREHNSSTVVSDSSDNSEANKASKRRHSRSNLEIDMKDTLLEESLKTNGIGEHVKLQKRRKVSVDQTTVNRPDAVTKDSKKKTPQANKRTPKTPTEKKSVKRKLNSISNIPKAKRMLIEASADEDPRLTNVAALPDPLSTIPKTKSALLLDNLIRKNSIDRVEAKGYASDKELNPAKLFLCENVSQTCDKNTLNINNNVVENNAPVSGVRPNTKAAVTRLIEKKLASKNACKLEQVDSKIIHSLKSVLEIPTNKLKLNHSPLTSPKCKTKNENKGDIKSADKICKDKCEIKDSIAANENVAIDDAFKTYNVYKSEKVKSCLNKSEHNDKLVKESHSLKEQSENDSFKNTTEDQSLVINKLDKPKRCKLSDNVNGQIKTKSIEKVVKLLGSKKPVEICRPDQHNVDGEKPKEFFESLVNKVSEQQLDRVAPKLDQAKAKNIEKIAKLLDSRIPTSKESFLSADDDVSKASTRTSTEIDKCSENTMPKRCKLTNGELKAKNVEKVVKLLVSKKPAIKTDEATLVVEDACASPVTVGKRARRRRSGAGTRRVRRAPLSLIPPALSSDTQPRWSNGWQWDSEDYLSKVYLSNDSRLDKTARCWTRMKHESGDSITRGDCVLLRANTPRAQPFVARVASMWENPDDREMMVSLVWYYRPEHTERGREPADAPDEVFASRHRDANSVACIEDKCYVLTFNEYCRYRKRLKATEEGITITPSIVPPLPASEITPAVAPNDSKLPPSVSPELVLFCRKIYDFRSKKYSPQASEGQMKSSDLCQFEF